MRQILRQTQDPHFSRLLDTAMRLRERQRLLLNWLGSEAHGNFHILGWEKQVLQLGARSGAWKQWLRQHEERLTACWNRHYPREPVKKIQCRIQPRLAENLGRNPPRDRKVLNRQPLGAAALRDAAQDVEDISLAAAMRRLANTLEKN